MRAVFAFILSVMAAYLVIAGVTSPLYFGRVPASFFFLPLSFFAVAALLWWWEWRTPRDWGEP